MNETVPVQSGGAENAKLTLAVLLLLGGIVAFYLLGGRPDWLRWMSVVAGAVLAAMVFGATAHGSAFWRFMVDSRIELRKVVWPTREETGKTTLAVFAFVITAGFFFWLLDLFLSWATRLFTGQGG
jgi:preprotein translocase subunit SecE